MKRKITCLGIISILLLSSLSLTAIGTKVNDNNDDDTSIGRNQIDLVYDILTDYDGNKVSMPHVELLGTDIVISCVFHNFYFGPTEQFMVAFYWNNDTEPFDIEPYQLEQNQVVFLVLGISLKELPDKNEYPTLKVKIVLDYNNDITESNYYDDAENNNIAYSNTLQNPKAKTINLSFSNFLVRLLVNFPLLHRLLNL